MIITTTPTIENRTITEYKGIVFSEVIAGVNAIKDLAAGFRDIFGGRSQSYEDELLKARQEALFELDKRAEKLSANAIVGVKIDVETVGTGSMLMVVATGTAVRITKT